MLPRFFFVVFTTSAFDINCTAKRCLTSKGLVRCQCSNLGRFLSFLTEVLPHGIFIPVGGVSHNARR